MGPGEIAGARLAVRRAQRLVMRSTWFMRPLPDVLVLGALKSGSTSLYEMLVSHPDARGAVRKEVHFFDQHFDRGLRWYRGQFPLALPGGSRTAVEATPMYLSLPSVPARVASTGLGPKFIVVLRDPVHRAISHWKHRLREGRDHRSLDEVIAQESEVSETQAAAMPDEEYKRLVLAHGQYAAQLARWFALFPRDRFYIVESERLFSATQSVMADVFGFASLRPWQVPDITARNVGDARTVEGPAVQALSEYYEQRNEHLFEMLGKSYTWT